MVTAEVQPCVAHVKLVLEITARLGKLNSEHNQKKEIKQMYKNKSSRSKTVKEQSTNINIM